MKRLWLLTTLTILTVIAMTVVVAREVMPRPIPNVEAPENQPVHIYINDIDLARSVLVLTIVNHTEEALDIDDSELTPVLDHVQLFGAGGREWKFTSGEPPALSFVWGGGRAGPSWIEPGGSATLNLQIVNAETLAREGAFSGFAGKPPRLRYILDLPTPASWSSTNAAIGDFDRIRGAGETMVTW